MPTYSRGMRSQEDRDEVTLQIATIVLGSAVGMLLFGLLWLGVDRIT